MDRRSFMSLVPVALLVAACGGSDPVGGGSSNPPAPPPPPPPPVPGANVTIRIIDNAFVDPSGGRNTNATVTVNVNDSVGWRHDGAVSHTVTSTSVPTGAMAFDSGNLSGGDTFSVTFTVAGTYVYHCEIHPGIMFDATVIVQ